MTVMEIVFFYFVASFVQAGAYLFTQESPANQIDGLHCNGIQSTMSMIFEGRSRAQLHEI